MRCILMKSRLKPKTIRTPPPWLVTARYADGSERRFWRWTWDEAKATEVWAKTHESVLEVIVYDRRKRSTGGRLY